MVANIAQIPHVIFSQLLLNKISGFRIIQDKKPMKTRRESADVSHDGETLEQTRQRLQEISDLKEEWREDRENNITLFQQPCRTFHLCGMSLCSHYIHDEPTF